MRLSDWRGRAPHQRFDGAEGHQRSSSRSSPRWAPRPTRLLGRRGARTPAVALRASSSRPPPGSSRSTSGSTSRRRARAPRQARPLEPGPDRRARDGGGRRAPPPELPGRGHVLRGSDDEADAIAAFALRCSRRSMAGPSRRSPRPVPSRVAGKADPNVVITPPPGTPRPAREPRRLPPPRAPGR